MRILFLTQVLPYPLVGGAKIRAYYVLRYLAEHHQVTLVSFVRDDDGETDADHLGEFCHAVHTVPIARSSIKDGWSLFESLARKEPLIIVRDRLRKMEKLIKELTTANSYDVIHADQTSMAQYALFARESSKGHKPRILLDQHNALFLVVQRQANYEQGTMKRLLWTREARLLAHYESNLLREFNEIMTVTANDRETLLKLLNEKEKVQRAGHVTVMPICVDPDSQPLLPRSNKAANIVHLGTMFWPPNVEGVLWFAKEVLPTIVRTVPEASFTIVGKDPPQKVTALAESKTGVRAPIRVTGFVADPTPILTSSQVFVVPLLAGGGMRVKILDAWQWGLPVVSTSIGAEGILTRPNENILIADDPKAFSEAVIRLLTEPDLADTLRKNGRDWVDEHYNRKTVYRNLDEIYRRLDGAPT